MRVDGPVLLAIAGMALVTYSTRLSGLWLLRRMTVTDQLEEVLGYVPGCVLVAIVAPTIVGRGLAEIIAAVVTVLVALRTSNLLLAMIAGVFSVWALRILL